MRFTSPVDTKAILGESCFGFAFARTNMSGAKAYELLDVPGFTAAEIQHELLFSDDAMEKKVFTDRFKSVHAGSIIDRSLSSYVLSASRSIQDDFVAECEKVMEKLARRGLRSMTMDFGMNTVLASPELRSGALEILRRLAPGLVRLKITLMLPFRIPALTSVRPADMSAFLRESMIPNLKVSLDIHPHELHSDFTVKDAAGTLPYEARSVFFTYDADCGNRLMKQHLQPWFDAFAFIGFRGPYFLCPYSKNHRLSVPEAESFIKLVSDLRK